jgi:hypothetical protein
MGWRSLLRVYWLCLVVVFDFIIIAMLFLYNTGFPSSRGASFASSPYLMIRIIMVISLYICICEAQRLLRNLLSRLKWRSERATLDISKQIFVYREQSISRSKAALILKKYIKSFKIIMGRCLKPLSTLGPRWIALCVVSIRYPNEWPSGQSCYTGFSRPHSGWVRLIAPNVCPYTLHLILSVDFYVWMEHKTLVITECSSYRYISYVKPPPQK